MVTEVRESIEIVQTSEYNNFLSSYFNPFRTLLETTKPQAEENHEHKLRNLILEIFNRLPQNDVLRPLVPELMHLAVDVLAKDNEENALVCLRIIFDLHKTFRPTLEQQVQPFLDFVCKVCSLHGLPLQRCVCAS